MPKISITALMVLGCALAANYFLRVGAPEGMHSTGVIVYWIRVCGYWPILLAFITSTALLHTLFWFVTFFQGARTQDVYLFWKAVRDHPDTAYEWFLDSDAWAVCSYPLNKEHSRTFSKEDWAGPFDLYVPSIGSRVCIFGRTGQYEQTREQFISRVAMTKPMNLSTDDCRGSVCAEQNDAHALTDMSKILAKRADDGPVSFHILIDRLKVDLERDFPDVLLFPKWPLFEMVATVGGCVALALRLHFEVSKDHRTPLELRMRQALADRFKHSERMYEDCYRFVTSSLTDIPREDRGTYVFILIAMWAYAVVSEGRKIEQDEWIVGQLAETYQNETSGFWVVTGSG